MNVVPITGKGVGVVATREIKAGERLLAEAPVLAVPMLDGGMVDPEELERAVQVLDNAQRSHFFQLSQNSMYGEKRTASGIAQTNGIPFRWRNAIYGAVYLNASRFNHDCNANACFNWVVDEEQSARFHEGQSTHVTGRLVVHSIKRIRPGDEITLNYLGFLQPREVRQARLRSSFGFSCVCGKCSLSGTALSESEERVTALRDAAALSETLNSWASPAALISAAPAEVLARLDAWHGLLVRECPPDGIHAGTSELLLQAFVEFCDEACTRLSGMVSRARANEASGEAAGRQLRVPLGELSARALAYEEAARAWAGRARDVARVMAGEDSASFRVHDAALARCWRHDGSGKSTHLNDLWIEAGASNEWRR